MLKYFIPLFILTVTISSCKKEISQLEGSKFLDVQEKNMGVVAKKTATWCGPCGGWGFNYFANLKDQYKDEAVYMAFKTAFTAVSPQGDVLYNRVNDYFGIGNSTPTFFFNFDTINGLNYSGAGSVANHINSEVIANANYEYTLSEDKIHLKTTTKFFKSVEGDFVISPFLIIDHQIGSQEGHSDSPNTEHPSFVANLAHPINTEVIEPWAYDVAKGKVNKGYEINLEFEVFRKTEWTEDDISFALVLFKRVGNQYKFVNAFTK